MMTDTLIQVEGVSKKFCRDLKRSLWYGLQDLGSELSGSRGRNLEHLRPQEFWSVRDISFEVKRGECLALIGPNGAGKSTLLRMLNGLIKPTGGSITLQGRVNGLIALGAGFNPVLTGRENVYINGSVLGFTKKEIDNKYDEIVEFAELEDFMETPVRNYSSGMTVRLGFAIAAQMEPDVLLLDEVLAVGDAGFRAKCFNTIMEMMQSSAVVFVSHSMPQIARVATKTLVMDHGECKLFTQDTGLAMETYYSSFRRCETAQQVSGSGRARLQSIHLENPRGDRIESIPFKSGFTVRCDLFVEESVQEYVLALDILSREQQLVLQYSAEMDGASFSETGDVKASVELETMRLAPGQYSFNLFVSDKTTKELLLVHRECLHFQVVGHIIGHAPVSQTGLWNVEPAGLAVD